MNDIFEATLDGNPNLSFLQSRMLFIYNGNYRYKTKMNYIDKLHQNHLEWHFTMDCINLDIIGRVGLALNAMHDVNKYFM